MEGGVLMSVMKGVTEKLSMDFQKESPDSIPMKFSRKKQMIGSRRATNEL